MPEQISKYPEVTIRVLEGAGAHCGKGVERKILTKCPPKRFCSLSTGEICIYGIKEIPQMTQITAQELARVVCPPGAPSGAALLPVSSLEVVLWGLVFLVGFVLGSFCRRRAVRARL